MTKKIIIKEPEKCPYRILYLPEESPIMKYVCCINYRNDCDAFDFPKTCPLQNNETPDNFYLWVLLILLTFCVGTICICRCLL